MADKSQRELYLSDPLHHVEHSDHDKVIPPWLTAEASKEEDWEKVEKDALEVSGWARQFRTKFLEAFKVENRQTVRVWEPEKAAAWLREKLVKDETFDRVKASEVLAAAQCDEEKRTEVMRLAGEDETKEPKPESGSPTRNLSKVNPPPTAAEVIDAAQEEKFKLHRTKKVGSYGIVLTEESCMLYRRGEKLAELATEDCGGFPVLAEEVDAMAEETDVVAFFDLRDDLEEIRSQGWLKPKAAPIVDGPGLQRLDQEPAPPAGATDPDLGVPQAMPRRTDPLNPGPASLVPGSAVPSAPQIPGQDGK